MSQLSWKMFNEIASTYDRVNRIISLGMDQKWRRQVAYNLPVKKNLRILDLATGTGDQLLSLFQHGPAISKASGLDLSEQMLAIAKEKFAKTIYKDKTELLHADAQKIPFPNQTFDAVTCSFGIRNVPNPLAMLQEVYRVLKPQGKCLILEFSLPPYPLRGMYLIYLRHILPRVGAFFSSSLQAYTYLNQTIESFPSGDGFAALMRKSNYNKIVLQPMALGAVTLYTGVKS